ncbi:unnamed protein product [Eretmochelys imbricata]
MVPAGVLPPWLQPQTSGVMSWPIKPTIVVLGRAGGSAGPGRGWAHTWLTQALLSAAAHIWQGEGCFAGFVPFLPSPPLRWRECVSARAVGGAEAAIEGQREELPWARPPTSLLPAPQCGVEVGAQRGRSRETKRTERGREKRFQHSQHLGLQPLRRQTCHNQQAKLERRGQGFGSHHSRRQWQQPEEGLTQR